ALAQQEPREREARNRDEHRRLGDPEEVDRDDGQVDLRPRESEHPASRDDREQRRAEHGEHDQQRARAYHEFTLARAWPRWRAAETGTRSARRRRASRPGTTTPADRAACLRTRTIPARTRTHTTRRRR